MIANTGNAERIAAAVAAELGAGWAVSAGYRGDGSDARLTADGVSVHLMTDSWGHRDRYVFSGDLPRDARDFLHYRATVPEITTAPTKTPAQIAADIRRRLLPGLVPLTALVLTAKAEHDAAETARGELAAELAALMGGTVYRPTHRQDGEPVAELGRYGDPLRVRVKTNHGGAGATFEIDCGADIARTLARAIAGLRGEVAAAA